MLLYGIVAVIILIADQALKIWVAGPLAVNTEVRELIPGVLQLTHTHNTGIAFSIGQEWTWFQYVLIVLAVAFSALIIWALAKKKIHGNFGRWAAVLVMAGALGNCIDRVMNGYVVDMFQFQFMNFPVFNLADTSLTIGAILFCLYIIFHRTPAVPAQDARLGAAPSGGYARGGGYAPAPRQDMPREDPNQIHGGNIEQIRKPDLDEMTDRLPKIGALKMAQDRAARGQSQPVRRPRPAQDQYAQGPSPRQQQPPRQQPDARLYDYDAPQPSQAPQVQPRRKSSDSEFSLDDIMDEFRD